jgi:ABC-type glycerol-3-phosphate transport system permease component
MMVRASKTMKSILLFLAVVALCLLVLVPFIFMVSYSLRTNAELYDFGITLIPKNITFSSYVDLWKNNAMLTTWIWNTLYVTGVSTLLVVIASTMMGYAIARFRFKGRKGIWFTLAMTQSIPWVIALIPLYMTLSSFKMLDRMNTVMWIYTACFIPTSTWLLVGFFKKIPQELDDAARIDGCSNWGVLLRIVLPVSMNALSAIALTAFIGGWGDYITATTILKSKGHWTLPIAIQYLKGPFYTEWTQIMALGTIISVPVVILFLWLEKYLVNLMAGGIKE